MKLVTSLKQVQDLSPVFGDRNYVYFVAKGYGDFSTYYLALHLSSGLLHDFTPFVTSEIQRCISSQQLLPVSQYDESILEANVPVLWTTINQSDASKHNFNYDVARYFVQLDPKVYQRVNQRVVEALILTLTGEIDGDQFVKGIIAASPAIGLSNNTLDLVKELKITRIYTGGLKLETSQRIVNPSELYLIR